MKSLDNLRLERDLFDQLLRLSLEASSSAAYLEAMVPVFCGLVNADGCRLLIRSREGLSFRAIPEDGTEIKCSPAVWRKLQETKTLDVSRKSERLFCLNNAWADLWSVVLSLPIDETSEAEPVGLLQLGFRSKLALDPEKNEILRSGAGRLWAAAQKIRIHEDRALREDNLHAQALRMLQVEELERQRVSRELHDGPGQDLVVVRLQLEMLELSIPAAENEWRERVTEAKELAEKTILDIRKLISDLRPPVLDQLGLNAGIRQLLSRFRRTFPCDLHFQEDTLPKLNRDFEIIVYRLLQECLMNIRQHSEAKRVVISLKCDGGVLRLQVQDDGRGFEYSTEDKGAKKLGLAGLLERATLIGGTVQIVSTPAEQQKSRQRAKSGTKVDIQIPIS